MYKIFFIALFLSLAFGPAAVFAADEAVSAARDAGTSSGTADGTAQATDGAATAPADGASPRATPTPPTDTSPTPTPTSSAARPAEIKVIEVTEPAHPPGKTSDAAEAAPKKANTTLLAVSVTMLLGGLAWFISKFFFKANTEKKEEKDDARCKNIKALLEQKIKEMEEKAKSWPEDKLKELLIEKTLTAEQKALLARYNAAKEQYENLKKTVDLLKGKYDLCMLKLPSADNIKLVKAELSDIEKLLIIENSLTGTKIYSAMTDKKEWEDAFAKGETIYLVKRSDEILGNVSYERRPDGSIHISGLAVSPRFQKQGVGKEVVKRILEEIKDARRVELVTHPENTAAIKLYESFGFKTEARKENYFGDGEPRLIMVLNK